MIWGPLGVSVAPWIKARPALLKRVMPLAQMWVKAAGYRQVGYKYDDIIQVESDIMQKAIGRLTEREGYDRVFRTRRAIQQEILHRDLPEAEQTKPEEDVRYLTPHIEALLKEEAERAEWDNLAFTKRSKPVSH